MFKITQPDAVWWPVRVEIPADGGIKKTSQFMGQFRIVDRDRLKAMVARADNDDDAFLAEVFIGWDGVSEEDGTVVPFSEEARTRLLNILYVRSAVLSAFFDAHSGRASPRRGNTLLA